MPRYIKRTSFPIALVLVVVAALFTLRGEAQLKKAQPYAAGTRPALKPMVVLPVGAAISTPLRDIKPSAEIDLATLQEFERRVVNQLNSDLELPGANQVNVPSFDAAISGKPNLNAPVTPNSVTPPAI